MTLPRGRLIIVCGLPGTGKTTVAAALAARTGATVFSSDDWMDALAIDLWDEDRRDRTEQLQWQQAKALLALGGTAIIEWGTWSGLERDELRRGARQIGAAVELIYLTADPAILFERISRRGRENPPITLAQLEEWSTAIEAPGADELALYDPPAETANDRP